MAVQPVPAFQPLVALASMSAPSTKLPARLPRMPCSVPSPDEVLAPSAVTTVQLMVLPLLPWRVLKFWPACRLAWPLKPASVRP